MLLFHNDYNEACHQAIMKKMHEFANMQMPGYGEDPVCGRAADLIRELCGNQGLGVHFLVGGTQTNLTVIAASLRPHQGVIGAKSAHINVHETGAIEATGHKVIGLPSPNGKITAEQIHEEVVLHFQSADAEHMAQPKMVYLSNPTELGTIYYLDELERISAVCKQHNLYLFVDGARLGYGLTAADNDVTLADLARLCDVFYIGGTKVGAMFGEAVVISNPDINRDFRYIIKQHGGMLAKGWLLGAQFEALLADNLYFDISAHANKLAEQLRKTLLELGYPMLVETTTNQLFPILPDELLQKLSLNFSFSEMERIDTSHRAVRFCTSWATRQENVDALCDALIQLSK